MKANQQKIAKAICRSKLEGADKLTIQKLQHGLDKMNVKGNIIIGILFFSIIAWATGLAKFNGIASSPPPMTYLFEFDLSAAMTAGMSTVIFTLLFIDALTVRRSDSNWKSYLLGQR